METMTMTKIEGTSGRSLESGTISGNFAEADAPARKPYRKPVLDDFGDASEVTRAAQPRTAGIKDGLLDYS